MGPTKFIFTGLVLKYTIHSFIVYGKWTINYFKRTSYYNHDHRNISFNKSTGFQFFFLFCYTVFLNTSKLMFCIILNYYLSTFSRIKVTDAVHEAHWRRTCLRRLFDSPIIFKSSAVIFGSQLQPSEFRYLQNFTNWFSKLAASLLTCLVKMFTFHSWYHTAHFLLYINHSNKVTNWTRIRTICMVHSFST